MTAPFCSQPPPNFQLCVPDMESRWVWLSCMMLTLQCLCYNSVKCCTVTPHFTVGWSAAWGLKAEQILQKLISRKYYRSSLNIDSCVLCESFFFIFFKFILPHLWPHVTEAPGHMTTEPSPSTDKGHEMGLSGDLEFKFFYWMSTDVCCRFFLNINLDISPLYLQ